MTFAERSMTLHFKMHFTVSQNLRSVSYQHCNRKISLFSFIFYFLTCHVSPETSLNFVQIWKVTDYIFFKVLFCDFDHSNRYIILFLCNCIWCNFISPKLVNLSETVYILTYLITLAIKLSNNVLLIIAIAIAEYEIWQSSAIRL